MVLPPPSPRRRAGARARLAGLCACLWLSACSGLTLEGDQAAKDQAARVETWMSSALTYYDGGNYEQAAIQFERVLTEEPHNQRAKRGLANALLMQDTPKKLRRAEALLLEVKDLDWSHAELGDRRFEVLTDLARVYSSLADYYERDIRALEEQLSTDEHIDAAAVRANLARQVAERDQLIHRALPLYREVLARSPENPYALSGLAKAHLQLGNDDLGLNFAERYLTLSRKSQQNWRRELEWWEKQAGRNVTRAQRDTYIQKIQGAREKEKLVLLMIGSVHMRREDFGKAIEAYTALLEIDPAVPAAYIERAQARAAHSQYRLAIQDIEEYLKLTDPQRHRTQRTNAVGLLDRYRLIVERQEGARGPAPAAPQPAAGDADPYGLPPAGR